MSAHSDIWVTLTTFGRGNEKEIHLLSLKSCGCTYKTINHFICYDLREIDNLPPINLLLIRNHHRGHISFFSDWINTITQLKFSIVISMLLNQAADTSITTMPELANRGPIRMLSSPTNNLWRISSYYSVIQRLLLFVFSFVYFACARVKKFYSITTGFLARVIDELWGVLLLSSPSSHLPQPEEYHHHNISEYNESFVEMISSSWLSMASVKYIHLILTRQKSVFYYLAAFSAMKPSDLLTQQSPYDIHAHVIHCLLFNLVNLLIGVTIGFILLHNFAAILVYGYHLELQLYQSVILNALEWLDHSPGGVKLNPVITAFVRVHLSSLVTLYLRLSSRFIVLKKAALVVCIVSGLGGASLQLLVALDIWTLLNLHLSLCHWLVSALLQMHLSVLYSFWCLFQGISSPYSSSLHPSCHRHCHPPFILTRYAHGPPRSHRPFNLISLPVPGLPH